MNASITKYSIMKLVTSTENRIKILNKVRTKTKLYRIYRFQYIFRKSKTLNIIEDE